jgi:FADH2 O2-dependent halogenase
MTRYDLAVVGSGFAGSLIALIARRLGLSVLLLEKGSHPRVVIGESSTPLSNLLLEELADRYNLPLIRPLAKWGSWQQSYPHLACGLKRGFSFFHHSLDETHNAAPRDDRHLLVAASPHDAIADTHWYRADVDAWLVKQAQDLGAHYIDRITLSPPICESDGWTLVGMRGTQEHLLHARFLLDATGPRGFLHHAFQLQQLEFPEFPETCALYSHFSGVGNFPSPAETPYPVNAAAMHHVFDGGWMWILQFNNGITSAGFAATPKVSERFGFTGKEAAWDRLLHLLPEVQRQFRGAKALRPFSFIPQLSFRSATISGPGWALMPSAAGFVDPLLSTGIALSLFGVSRLARLLEQSWNTLDFERGIATYAKQTDEDLLATAHLIGALYRFLDDFPTFRALSLLYFAAASYSETVRRLGRPELAGSFLLRDHSHFGPESHRLLARAQGQMSAEARRTLEDDIYKLIEPFDVAGLSSRPTDFCYPVRADDLLAARAKLGATSEEVKQLLERSDFYATAPSAP